MAQTIASIALIICIIVSQHLYNWAVRKIHELDNDSFPQLFFAVTAAMIGLTFILFKTLLFIN